MNKIPISAIIVHYQTEQSTLKLISQLKNLSEIMVLDNSQSKILRKELLSFKNVHLVSNKANTGFAHACNQGLLKSKNDYVLFLNSDLEIEEKQLTGLLKELKTKKLTAITPTLINESGEADPNYRKNIPDFWNLIKEFSPLGKIFKTKKSKKITLAGAYLLVDKKKFLKLGAWDERFYIWFEDSDLSHRLLKEKHNFKISDKIKVVHQGGESFAPLKSDWKSQVFFQSLRSFNKKHFSFSQRLILDKITKRFADNKFYPANKNIRASLVVPNLYGELLDKFLKDNYHFFDFSQDELIIVSSAEQKYQLRKKYPEVIFIFIKKNHGFAPTVNLGFRRATGQWIGTINDDVILEKNWIEKLILKANQYEKEKKVIVGSLSPIVKNLGNKIETFGVTVLPQGKALRNQIVDSEFKESNGFNAAAVLFKREVLKKLGLFDESFGSYLEDLDLGLRIQKNGYINLAIRNVEILHLGQQSSGRIPLYKAWWDFKNWWILTLKQTNLKTWIKHGPAILIERSRNFSGLLKALYHSKKQNK